MKSLTLNVESILIQQTIKQQQTITIKDGIIQSITDLEDNGLLFLSGVLLPGFIDIQVNGGGGVLFNQSPDFEAIVKIAKAHQAFGTTSWLPTLVTDSIEKMNLAADAVAQAITQKELGVVGIHFEGPHLSVTKKGIHSDAFIRQLTDAEKNIYSRKDIGKVMVTLAPEMVAPELITELVELGVIVSLGHSNATFGQTQKALQAGATGFTHLFNAMSAFTSREPGMVGAALLDQNSYSGLIMDGIHVHPESARATFKTQPNLMLVTDAMPPVGSSQDSFEFFGEKIQRQGNQLTDQYGRLAGSVLDMASAVKNAMEMLQISLPKAVALASKNPALFLGLHEQYGSLAVNKKANMVLINGECEVISSWIEGLQAI